MGGQKAGALNASFNMIIKAGHVRSKFIYFSRITLLTWSTAGIPLIFKAS